MLSPPNNTSIQFDAILMDFRVDTLGAPMTVNQANFSHDLFSPAVPEPMASSLLLAGLATLAWKVRRRV